MQSKPLKLIYDSCLEHAASLPVPKRVLLYRALAEFCHNRKKAATLLRLADDLEAADQRCAEFAFTFSRSN